jgi:Flp pilus assembly protein TadD
MVGGTKAGFSRFDILEADMPLSEPYRWRGRRRWRVAAASAMLALLVAGCNSSRHMAENDFSGSLPDASASPEQLQRATEYWSKKFALDPTNKTAAINLSHMLRAEGKPLQAVLTMRQIEVQYPGDREVLAEIGKGLAEAGRAEEAEKALAAALAAGEPDWQLLSAHGAALDQLRQHKKAREEYARALAMVQNEPSVLNNLGLSYALDSNLPKAEEVLRKASEQPQAGREVAENLALILGLQGKFDDAEEVARKALPEATVTSNMTYLKQLLSQPKNWAKLQQLEASNTTEKTEKKSR